MTLMRMLVTVSDYLAIGCDRLAAEYYAGGRKRLTGAKANPDFTLTLTYEEREERIFKQFNSEC